MMTKVEKREFRWIVMDNCNGEQSFVSSVHAVDYDRRCH